ncbi:hypothetical protein [Haloarcula amylolytica]|uniref:hypothetical protein n=1 Tax=Haloarcula amylolytica TaxID=396317 RepID=UPI003C735A4C
MAIPDPSSETEEFIQHATQKLEDWLEDRTLDIFQVNEYDPEVALQVVDDISQLTSMISVQIEAQGLRYLSDVYEDHLPDHMEWVRNDRSSGEKYPDLALVDHNRRRAADSVANIVWPGIEIKAWCPLTTEFGSRHKKSQTALAKNPSTLLLACWLPEHVAYGAPNIFATWSDDALAIARSRDEYWMQPPESLVREPNDTSDRTQSKQRSVTKRYLIENSEDTAAAGELATDLGLTTNEYSPTAEFREKVDTMLNKFNYSGDSANWRKLRRLHHQPLLDFQDRVESMEFAGRVVGDWRRDFQKGNATEFQRLLRGNKQESLSDY